MRGLLLLAILALAAFTLWPFLARWVRSLPRGYGVGTLQRNELVKDPVCQTYVVMSRAVRREIGGAVTYFCSADCAERYLRGGRRV